MTYGATDCQIVMQLSADDRPDWHYTFGMRFGDMLDPGANITAVSNAMFDSTLAGFHALDVTLSGAKLYDLSDPTHIPYEWPGNAAAFGTVLGLRSPPGLAVVITHNSMLSGPSGRGRTYGSCFSMDAAFDGVNSGLFVSDWPALYAEGWNDLRADWEALAVPATQCVHSRKLELLTAVGVARSRDRVPDTQKRRNYP